MTEREEARYEHNRLQDLRWHKCKKTEEEMTASELLGYYLWKKRKERQ